MRKSFWMAGLLLAGNAALAVDYKAGNGDIADASAWGGALPGGTTSVTFPSQSASCTYTASADVTFGAFIVRTGTKTFDFTRTPERKVTVGAGHDGSGDPASAKGYGFALYAQSGNATLKGGLWDFGNTVFSTGYGSGNTKETLTLTDGVVVTNVSNFYWGDRGGTGGGGGKCTITGGARVHANGDFMNYATGKLNNLELSGGAEVHAAGTFFTDYSGAPSTTTGRNNALITGAGTLLAVNYIVNAGLAKLGTSFIGRDHPSNTVTVADGAKWFNSTPIWLGEGSLAVGNCLTVDNATLESGTVYVGRRTDGNRLIARNRAQLSFSYLGVGGFNSAAEATAHDNLIEFDDSTVYVTNSVNVGWPGYGNRMTVRNGTALSAGSMNMGAQHATGTGNTLEAYDSSLEFRAGSGVIVGNVAGGQTLLVSNCAFTAGNFECGKAAAATGNVVRFVDCGSRVKLWQTKSGVNVDLFSVSGGNLAEFVRTDLDFDAKELSMRMGMTSSSNTLRLVGSRLTATKKTPSIGLGQIQPGNRIELLDDSVMDVIRFRMLTPDNTLLVSNSVVQATDVSNGIHVGYKEVSTQTFEPFGNAVILQGDHPKFGGGDTKVHVQFTRQSTLHLDVPPTGYADGYALVEGSNFTLDATSKITVSMDEYLRTKGGRILVARTTNGCKVDAAALAASNALLPDRCRFATSEDGLCLYLRVPRNSGLSVLVR